MVRDDFDFDAPDFELDTSEFDESVREWKRNERQMAKRGKEFQQGLAQGIAGGKEAFDQLKEDKWKFVVVVVIIFVAYVLTKVF